MGTLTLTGFAAYLLLWAAVMSGIGAASPRRGRSGWVRFGARRHESLSLAALALGSLHGAEAVSEPSGSAWWVVLARSGATVQYGVAALLLLAVVTFSFYLRRRLPGRGWRGLHLLAYPAYALVLWHALAAGANAWLPAVRVLYAATAGAVAAAGIARLTARPKGFSSRLP